MRCKIMPELFSPKTEEKILEFWKREQIFEKSLTFRQAQSKKKFIFYEGPPFPNAKAHVGNILTRCYKDAICRYKNMAGFNTIGRRAGWDVHGLPVELQLEKQLGLRGKPDIEKYGIAEFNSAARQMVFGYKDDWDKLTERIGFWIDSENYYITSDSRYIESLWAIIAQIWNKKLLYRDFKVVPYCSRCGTSLSNFEVAQGYEKVSENSVYVKFKLKPNQKIGADGFVTTNDTYIISWTTTPWTLPGNIALAIGEKIQYEILKLKNGNVFIFAKDLKDSINIEEQKINSLITLGKNLLGLQYEPLFSTPQLKSKNSYKIYSANFVNTEEGTGVVHIAPMYGVDDFNLGAETDLPKAHTVDLEGKFIKGIGLGLDGVYVKSDKTEKIILDYLKSSKSLLRVKKYEHDYPFCWRCHSPLLYYAKSSWFIRMEKLKKKLLNNNKKINWVPANIKEGRFGEWLNEVKDWAFSRERYWGTPLPVWQCQKCKNERVIGSLEELDKFSAKKLKKGEHNWPYNKEGKLDLHRPYVDDLIVRCPKCSGNMKRVKEVIDVWFDSGAMPFAQYHWPFEKKLEYPADFISEGVDQTRGWFYTLHAVGTLMGKGPAFKNAICLGHILDGKGEKMSKSKGNVVDPWMIIDKYGVDALRWYFFTVNQPGDSKLFSEKDVEESLRKLILTLWNCFTFFKTYTERICVNPRSYLRKSASTLLDRWIISKLNGLIQRVTENLDKYDVTGAARNIENFVVNDLSLWYIRRSRRRFQKPETKEELKEASQTLAHTLLTLSKLSAPFIPFLSEEIFKCLNSKFKHSVHLEKWPKVNKKLIDKKLEKKMEKVREIVARALSERVKAKIKVRQPLNELRIKNYELRKEKELLDLIREEVNVKKITFGKTLKLDTKITPELKEEGQVREVIRHIQEMRKEAKFKPRDKILVRYLASPGLEKILIKNEKIILKEGKIKDFGVREKVKQVFDVEKEIKINQEKLWLGIKKI